MVVNTKPPSELQDATRIVRINRPFPLFRGGSLPNVEIAYECWGRLSKHKDNAILIFTGLSPSAHAASSADDPREGWWEYMVGPGKPIDTQRFFVVCINSLGSCFGSTGPASENPITGNPYRLDFPELTVEDIATAGREVFQSLGIEKLYSVIGASLGGLSALALAAMYPDEVKKLVCISAATHATPFAIAIRSLQREIIQNDPKWMNGNYRFNDTPKQGMRLARKLGLISYRSSKEFLDRFGRKRVFKSQPIDPPFSAEFEIETYLEYNANNFIDQFDTNCYLYLSRAIDWFDIAAHGGTLEAGIAKIKTSSNLIIGVETDSLFPVFQQQELAHVLTKNGLETVFVKMPSDQGHDAFLVDEQRFSPVVREFLANS